MHTVHTDARDGPSRGSREHNTGRTEASTAVSSTVRSAVQGQTVSVPVRSLLHGHKECPLPVLAEWALSGEPNPVSAFLSLSCTWHKFLRCMITIFPFLKWVCFYRWKDWLLGDLLAGLSVGFVQIPQGKKGAKPSRAKTVGQIFSTCACKQFLLLNRQKNM